jgi:hypothetical protein
MDTSEALAFLPNDDALVTRLLPDLTPDQRSDRWHLLTPQLDDLIGGKGLIALLAELAPTRWLSRTLSFLRAERLLDGLDGVMRRIRGKMGNLVPDVEGPRRYP